MGISSHTELYRYTHAIKNAVEGKSISKAKPPFAYLTSIDRKSVVKGKRVVGRYVCGGARGSVTGRLQLWSRERWAG